MSRTFSDELDIDGTGTDHNENKDSVNRLRGWREKWNSMCCGKARANRDQHTQRGREKTVSSKSFGFFQTQKQNRSDNSFQGLEDQGCQAAGDKERWEEIKTYKEMYRGTGRGRTTGEEKYTQKG